jgi:hypothetical protein
MRLQTAGENDMSVRGMKLKTLTTSIVVIMTIANSYSALAKQCIWNKAGFILDITWVHNDVVVRTDERIVGTGVCANDGDGTDYTIILSIKDAELARALSGVAVTTAGSVLGIPGAGAIYSATIDQLTKLGVLSAKSIFYVGTPEQDRYLDVWGTIYSPQTGYSQPGQPPTERQRNVPFDIRKD